MDRLDQVLTRGVKAIYPSYQNLKKRLKERPLSLYLGVDPSGTELHLGHSVVLRKLRQFQDLGHQVTLLIGDFTGRIGDPTDKSAARQKLSAKQVKNNAKTYQTQASKILNFSGPNPVIIEFNSRWHDRLKMADVIELASNFTVQQLEERDMFRRRRQDRKPIYLHEFLYPLLQAYDSVALNIDLEIGGSDQIFNMLTGRELVQTLQHKEKYVLATELLIGTDGQKMGKSLNNYLPITLPPNQMYGSLMAIVDTAIIDYFILTTDLPLEDINLIKSNLDQGQLNPMLAKKKLAFEIVKFYHHESAAKKAQEEFESVFQKRESPAAADELKVAPDGETLVWFLSRTGLAASRSEAKRLISAGGIRLDNEKLTDPETKLVPNLKKVLRVGKLKFVKLI